MYRLAIFDIDGTLLDTETTGVLSLCRTIKELMGIDMPYEQAYKYFGIPSKSVPERLGYTGDHDHFSLRWEENFVALSDLIVPFEGVTELLARIKSAGILTGIVTSRSHMEFEHGKGIQEIVQFFDHVICAEDAPRPKPYPDPILRCIELCSHSSGTVVPDAGTAGTSGTCKQSTIMAGPDAGTILTPADCIYLGDTEHDWRCAEAAGCDFALADWKQRGWQGIPAKYRFTDAKAAASIFCLSIS